MIENRLQMLGRRWCVGVLGLVFLSMFSFAQAQQTTGLSPQLQALVVAGDVDGIAATLAARVGSNDLGTLIEQVARSNPDIAAAVVNATLRDVSASGIAGGSLGATLQTLVSGAMRGLTTVIAPADVNTYAENVAANVRQVVAVVAPGDRAAQNALLASARAGVAQSVAQSAGTNSAVGQPLHADVSVRLQGTLGVEEVSRAQSGSPIVVTRGGGLPNNNLRPVVEPAQENPQTDIRSASPS